MFGVVIPPGVVVVRISALSGKKGKPPCLWEGPPSTDQGTIEAAIGRDPRIVRWLRKTGMVRSSVATVNVQIECYSQGQRVESIEVANSWPFSVRHTDHPASSRTIDVTVTGQE